jgi:hypothetical protein
MNMQWFLREENGKLSATRLAFLLWAVGVLVMWIIACVNKGELQAIDNSVVTVLGLLMGGKAVQRFGETTTRTLPATPPTTGS